MDAERKEWIAARRRRHAVDRKQAKAVQAAGIVDYPLDLPSLDRALTGDRRPNWLTTGYDWLDKPHRVAWDAMDEIRALRKYVLANCPAAKKGDKKLKAKA